jgi:fatty-acid desaturase
MLIKDPYSAKRGFWWSMFCGCFTQSKRSLRPVPIDALHQNWPAIPSIAFLDRYFLLLQVPLAVVLYALGGWSFVIYGIFVRAVMLWQSTWLINSASHMWGYRTFDVEDNSRNLWWAALLTYGEGWHNNHHAYPNVAKAGWQWWEIDPTWWVISGLKKLGLAKRVVMPPTH